MRIIFMGTPDFAVPSLERLCDAGCTVVAVYTQPDRPAGRGRKDQLSPVKEAAHRLGLKVVQPESLKREAAQTELAAFCPDVIVVAAFGQILPRAVLDLAPGGCLNLHASLLPRYRGAAPIAAAVLAGDTLTGITVIEMAEKLDSGPILSQAAISIASYDTTGSLAVKLGQIAATLIVEVLPRWRRGEILPRPQEAAKATYFPSLSKEAGLINWSRPAAVIEREVRAYQPWPGSFTLWQGRQLKILEAVASPGQPGEPPGTVSLPLPGTVAQAAFRLATGEGWLGVNRVQLEGRRAMTAAEFLAGQRDFAGARLG
jgi:methionyl-tRNA formyltransferase